MTSGALFVRGAEQLFRHVDADRLLARMAITGGQSLAAFDHGGLLAPVAPGLSHVRDDLEQ